MLDPLDSPDPLPPTPSVEPVLRSRLLPQISFRNVFALTLVSAVVAAVSRAAGAGGPIAAGVLAAIGYVLAFFAAMTVISIVHLAISSIWYSADTEVPAGSPFADGQLPPQILPPTDPVSRS